MPVCVFIGCPVEIWIGCRAVPASSVVHKGVYGWIGESEGHALALCRIVTVATSRASTSGGEES